MARLILVALLSTSLVVSGCTSSRTIPPQQALASLRAGDLVEVTMKSGTVQRVKVGQIDATSLTGRLAQRGRDTTTVHLALTEVESMERQSFSFWRTTGLAVGAAAGLVVAFLVALAIRCDGPNGTDACSD